MKRISVVLLLLLALTSFAIAQGGDKTKKTPEEKAAILTAKMEKELALDEEQAKKVKAINLISAEKTVNARNQAGTDKAKFRQQKIKIEQERDEALKVVLSGEQYSKFKEMLAEKKDKKKGKKST